MSTRLALNIFSTPARPLNLPIPVPPPVGGWTWPPTSVTLIAGEREAILVDTVLALEDSKRLADWIKASGKVLTAIYVTHGHLDHFLGASALLERFPTARVVATQATVDLVKAELDSSRDRDVYLPLFTDKVGSTVVVPEVLADNRLELEGHEIIAVPVGQSDISHSSYLYIPELKAVMVGDIAYNDVHPTLVNSDQNKRKAWIETLTAIQALTPQIVVAGHRREDAPNNAQVLTDTIGYLEDANRLLAEDPTAEQFIARMLAAHPTRQNLTTLLYGAVALGLRR